MCKFLSSILVAVVISLTALLLALITAEAGLNLLERRPLELGDTLALGTLLSALLSLVKFGRLTLDDKRARRIELSALVGGVVLYFVSEVGKYSSRVSELSNGVRCGQEPSGSLVGYLRTELLKSLILAIVFGSFLYFYPLVAESLKWKKAIRSELIKTKREYRDRIDSLKALLGKANRIRRAAGKPAFVIFNYEKYPFNKKLKKGFLFLGLYIWLGIMLILADPGV